MSEIEDEEQKPKLMTRRSLIWEKKENGSQSPAEYTSKKKKTLSFKTDRESESPQQYENDLDSMKRTSQKIKDYYFKSNDYI